MRFRGGIVFGGGLLLAQIAWSSTCDLAYQLQKDHDARTKWSEDIYRQQPKEDDTWQPRSSPEGIDTISLECLSCHDGTYTKGGNVRTSYHGGNTIGQSHPLGADYTLASLQRASLVKRHILDKRIILVDGRLSCISCHNMLNPAPLHLAVDNSGSQLCMTCHNR